MIDDENKRIDKQAIDIVTVGEGAVARIFGRFDIDASPGLRDRLPALFQDPHTKFALIDLSAVTHIDSSGVATLIETLRVARSKNVEMRLQGLEGRLLQLFQTTGILSLFNGDTQQRPCPGRRHSDG